MQAAPPPSSPPAASEPAPLIPPSTIKGASATITVTANDLNLVLTKSRRAESAMVRYQVFIRTDVDRKIPNAADPRLAQCGWRIRAYLQRTICFSSMTGLLGCTDPVSQELAEVETGAAELSADPTAPSCDLSFAPARQAFDRLSQALTASAQARFDEDYALNVRPQLLASGVKIAKPRS